MKQSSRIILITLAVSLLALAVAGAVMFTQSTQKSEPVWPETPQETQDPRGDQATCENRCGDGQCAEIVCLAIGCPCAETPESCPQDCAAPPNNEPVFCTLDAKICPDGSSVGRVSPNCEFAPCPQNDYK